MKTFAFFAALSLAVSGISSASTQSATPATKAPPAPCQSDVYRDFDFWLGDWEVFTLKDQKAGDNKISSHEGGCLILEQWTSVRGGTGQSYNFYNPETDAWRQLWVSNGAIIDYTGGLTDTGSMRLEGLITYQRTGQSAKFFGEWTANEDGSVTQHFEQYDAEKDVWNPWFTGIYRPIASTEDE